MNAKQAKVEALFDAALKFKPDQRPAFLAGACGGDSDLQWRKVDELANAVLMAGRKQFKEDEPIKVVVVHDEWGRSLMTQGRYAEAELHFRSAVAVRKKHNNTHGRRFSAESRLGECLFKLNKALDTAQSLLKDGYNGLDQRFKQLPDFLRLEIVGSALQRLTEFYDAMGKPAQAAQYKQKLVGLEKAEGRRLLDKGFLSIF